MKAKQSSRLLGILGAAAALSSAYVAAFSSSSSCYEGGYGNGYCEQDNNSAECGYDGGDCCECTCQMHSDDDHTWGCEVFACVDPDAACVDDDDITAAMVENCSYVTGIGDGYCDHGNNNEECGFDGGDCCECTCVSVYDDDYSCSSTGSGFACVDPAAPCVDDDDITIEQALNCFPSEFGDGWCDQDNNIEICGYDGGDCCECTCVNAWDDDYSCTANSACIDPSAPCVDDDDVTVDMVENCGYVGSVGNGWCDEENNNEACGYDGGDCCECTCEPLDTDDGTDDYFQNGCGNGFACIDPNAPCVNDDDITLDIVENCDSVSVGNGFCDMDNNNEACAYDGGDCCECTCEDQPNQECGRWSGFACIDPEAPCVDDDSFTVDMIESCKYPGSFGNGWCDVDNNTEECAYDGGDCCECTCESLEDDDYACRSNFACVDPSAPCVDDDSVTVDMLENCDWAPGIGDGYCSEENNTPECAFDGGDCCSCTCQSPLDDDYACYSFACIDPDAACVNDDDITVDMFENCGYVLGIGNGYCDENNNTEECGYDGGDCCECTCKGDDDDYKCMQFSCIDPNAPCVNDDDITVDMFDNCGYVSGIGDGWCDSYNNKEECGYDGGDCCSCTCESVWDDDYTCGEDAFFDCKDPSAACFGEETATGNDDDSTGSSSDSDTQYEFVPWEQTEPLPTVDDAVEVGTKTEVSVSATAHDVRPGRSSGEVGCGEAGGNGCAAANARDGINTEIESRWSCASKLLDDEGPCQIEFSFAEPQNIVDIQVAFWKGNERVRTLEVYVNGELTHTHESYADSTFNTLGVTAKEANTVMLESVSLLSNEWISLIEVLIFVTP